MSGRTAETPPTRGGVSNGTDRTASPLDSLLIEAIPCHFGRPRPFNGDGPTARMMAVERQRALWALAHEDATDTASPAGPVGQEATG